MCDERIIRRFAGSFVVVSLLLAHFVNPAWLWFTALVGANLIQYSFTDYCPLERLLGAAGWFGCRKA